MLQFNINYKYLPAAHKLRKFVNLFFFGHRLVLWLLFITRLKKTKKLHAHPNWKFPLFDIQIHLEIVNKFHIKMQRIETKIKVQAIEKIMRKPSFLPFWNLIIVFLGSELNLFTDLFFNSKVILLDKYLQRTISKFHLRNTEWVMNTKCFSIKLKANYSE